ncbi:MAG TPA: hypothetical protein ENJ30_02770 [Desulfobulbaceae bacterium]|nr:hypothetical protein [Desulfobulbaceae bacterium]
MRVIIVSFCAGFILLACSITYATEKPVSSASKGADIHVGITNLGGADNDTISGMGSNTLFKVGLACMYFCLTGMITMRVSSLVTKNGLKSTRTRLEQAVAIAEDTAHRSSLKKKKVAEEVWGWDIAAVEELVSQQQEELNRKQEIIKNIRQIEEEISLLEDSEG